LLPAVVEEAAAAGRAMREPETAPTATADAAADTARNANVRRVIEFEDELDPRDEVMETFLRYVTCEP
jgi:hypothetical protein